MGFAGYRKRLERDLAAWIEQGLIPETSRAPILASLPARGTGDGRGWLAMAGTILAGLAVITFIGDNWAAFPRGLKLILLTVMFLGTSFAAAWTHSRSEKISNGLSLLSALVFAGSVALIGQAYNLPGDPVGAVFLSGMGAALIGLAGRSAAASFAAIVFGGVTIFMQLGDAFFGWWSGWFWGMHLIAACVALNGYLLKSRALWHGLILSGMGLGSVHLVEISSLLTGHGPDVWSGDAGEAGMRSLLLTLFGLTAAIWGGLAGYGFWRDTHGLPGGRTLAGYGSWITLLAIALLAFPLYPDGSALHRLLWLSASGFALWFGVKHQFGWITAAAVLSFVQAVCVIFFDLGLALSSAALIFSIASLLSLGVVIVLKRRSGQNDGETVHD